jgi:hypothetical protein
MIRARARVGLAAPLELAWCEIMADLVLIVRYLFRYANSRFFLEKSSE